MRIRTANNRRRQRELRLRPTLEDKIYDQQCRLVTRIYPDSEFNLGWAVLEAKGIIEVSTKVYRPGHPILTSVGDYTTGKIQHYWE